MDYLRGKLRGKTPSWGRGSSPSPSPAPVPLQKCARNDALNYRALFEKEKHEKELFGARLAELENQQKVLQNNLKRFLDLKREMRSFQREAEESDRVVDELIKAVVPDFAPYKRPNDNALHGQEKRSRFLRNRNDEEKENDESWNQQRDRVKMSPWRNRRGSSSRQDNDSVYRGSRQDSECVYRALPVQADPDIPLQVTPDPDDPALPNLSYEWDEAATSHPSTPIGRYNYSVSSRVPSRLDELKLNLQFDVNSKKLPTKLQLEIRDKKGRVVFRKRQNLYYVKVQERLATLDASDDYIMTVTSITGTKQATEEVKIHNKFHNQTSDLDYTEPLDEMTESMSVPLVTEEDTLTVMETSTCRSPSDASITSGFDEKSIDSIFDLPLSPRLAHRRLNLTHDLRSDGIEASPQREGNEALPHREGIDVLPHREGIDVLPRREGIDVLPRREGIDVLPRRERIDVLPHREGIDVLPRRERIEAMPRLSMSTSPRLRFEEEEEGRRAGEIQWKKDLMEQNRLFLERAKNGAMENDGPSAMSQLNSSFEDRREESYYTDEDTMEETERTVTSQSISSFDEFLNSNIDPRIIEYRKLLDSQRCEEKSGEPEDWYEYVGAGDIRGPAGTVDINIGPGDVTAKNVEPGHSQSWAEKLDSTRNGRRSDWVDTIEDMSSRFQRSMESAYDEAVRDMSEVPSCVSPDVPDLEEVVEVSVVSSKDLEKVTPSRSISRTSGSPRKNPFILMKQPVIPEVLYRWQMGFRKGPAGYRKVPILKVQFKYDSTKNVLPAELDVSLAGETKRVRVGLGACQAELAPTEGAEHLVGVVSRDRTGQPDPSIPKFEIPVRGVADAEINQWYAEQPILTLPASLE